MHVVESVKLMKLLKELMEVVESTILTNGNKISVNGALSFYRYSCNVAVAPLSIVVNEKAVMKVLFS